MRALLCSLLLAWPMAAYAVLPYKTVHVDKVTDGDTFQISERWDAFPVLVWRIRPLGLDTPEVSVFDGAKCQAEIMLGKAASSYAVQLMQSHGMKVRLTKTTIRHDKYGGRLDAEVKFADGTSYAEAMIAAGYARPYFGGAKSDWCAPGLHLPFVRGERG